MCRSATPAAAATPRKLAGDGVGLRVVREHAAHAHATTAERGECLLEEGGAARAALVGQDGDVGVAAVVVDGDVQVVEAAGARGPGGAPADAVSRRPRGCGPASSRRYAAGRRGRGARRRSVRLLTRCRRSSRLRPKRLSTA